MADQDAGAARGRALDRGAAHRREPELPRGPARLRRSEHTHIFIVPAEGGTPRQLTQGPHDYSCVLAHAGWQGSGVLRQSRRGSRARAAAVPPVRGLRPQPRDRRAAAADDAQRTRHESRRLAGRPMGRVSRLRLHDRHLHRQRAVRRRHQRSGHAAHDANVRPIARPTSRGRRTRTASTSPPDDSGSRNLHYAPLDGADPRGDVRDAPRQPRRREQERHGRRHGDELPSAGRHHLVLAVDSRHAQAADARERRRARAREARRGRGDLVHVAGQLPTFRAGSSSRRISIRRRSTR